MDAGAADVHGRTAAAWRRPLDKNFYRVPVAESPGKIVYVRKVYNNTLPR